MIEHHNFHSDGKGDGGTGVVGLQGRIVFILQAKAKGRAFMSAALSGRQGHGYGVGLSVCASLHPSIHTKRCTPCSL